MITISPCKDSAKLREIFFQHGAEFNDNAGCVIACFGDEVIGSCLYYLDKESITVLHVEPTEDIMLADGILRSALHVAAELFVFKAFYTKDAPEDLFSHLGFVKDRSGRTLDMDKLFKGCDCKNPDNK